MVKRLAAVLLLSACTLEEGVVLIARDAGAGSGLEPDASVGDADAGLPEDAETLADADRAADADAQPVPRGVCRIGGADDGFYENFTGSALSAEHWLVAHGPVRFAGQSAQGGFVRDNVSVEDGALVLRVRGDRYTGSVRGIDATGRPLTHGRRTAAAVATRDLFASATYQVQGRLAGPLGVEFALWFVRDDDKSGAIDIATPGTNPSGQLSSAHVRMRSRDAASASENQFALTAPISATTSHILRFDWYTTANNAVRFWVEDDERWQTDRSLPSTRAGRLWLVAWVPDSAAADFDTAEIRIENAFVTPFGNDGDRCSDYELAGPFLTEP